jgi:Flp pilus assembly protein TadD
MNAQAEVDQAYRLAERGDFDAAEAACRRAIKSRNPYQPAAWTALGVVLREAGRLTESEAAYRQALAQAPRDLPALHNLGALLSHMERAEEALSQLDRAEALGLKAPQLHINRGRALVQLYRFEDAERAYERAVALDARDSTAQSSLAHLRYMQGDARYARDFEAAVRAHPRDAALRVSFAELLMRAGKLADAERGLRDFTRQFGASADARFALAAVLHQMGRLPEAEVEALEAVAEQPYRSSGVATLVSIQLALGQPDAALRFVQTQLERAPRDQRWIGYAALTARMLGNPLYRRLYDYDRFVRTYDLEAPAGWRSMVELNAALLHGLAARHRFARHPLDQSLRNGSQSARSLLTDEDPAIKALMSAFRAPIEAYRTALGDAADHPLSLRNQGETTLRGCWSVELRRDGFHVNHVHPAGWLSSAYYVSVPPETVDPQVKSGWLKFGEPPAAIPGINAERFVQPIAGRLVLFPSYMWHGTNAISGEDPRVTVAFDATPTDPA